jgi:hypothetical protein
LYVGYPESNAPFFSWPVTKSCMWDFRWHTLEVPGNFCTKLYRFLLVTGHKQWQLLKQEKQSSMICFTKVIIAQL